MGHPYRVLGFVLCIAGAVLAPIAYFPLASVPLTATALSSIVVGAVCIALGSTRPYVSAEAFQTALKPGVDNASALLEGLGLTTKALYLPSTISDGHPRTVIPVGNRDLASIQGKIPDRFIVRYGRQQDAMAIAVATLGSISTDLLKTRPGSTPEAIESATSYVLTSALDLASSVTVDFFNPQINAIDVVVRGTRLRYEDGWYHRCLGSPIASVVAAICSEALGQPVRIKEETHRQSEARITIEVVP